MSDAEKPVKVAVNTKHALRGCPSISPPLILVVLMMTATSLEKAEGMELDQAAAACPGGVCPGLGNAFYLPDLNALSTNTGGTKVFMDTTLGNCATFNRDRSTASRTLRSLDSMHSFVNATSSELSLDGTFASRRMSVQASASRTTGRESSHTSTFHSATLDVSQVSATVDFNHPECLDVRNLNPQFLRDFEALPPINSQNAGEPSSWDAYVQFLKVDGSHVMTQQMIGSRFQQWESSDSEESDIISKLRARACAMVEGRDEVGTERAPGWSVSGCAAYSREEKASAMRMSTHSETVTRGGSAETRNELAKGATPERLDAFIDSGRFGNQAIRYAFTPIWRILNRVYRAQCSTSGAGSSACQNLQRSRNLQAAYEGWLAIQCRQERSNNVTYQEMRTTAKPDELGIYSYQCWARKTGCVQNSDCRLGGAGSVCYCYGPTCFDTGDPISGTTENRTRVRGAQSGGAKQGVNNSCTYRFGATCGCNQSWRGGLADRALYLQSAE